MHHYPPRRLLRLLDDVAAAAEREEVVGALPARLALRGGTGARAQEWKDLLQQRRHAAELAVEADCRPIPAGGSRGRDRLIAAVHEDALLSRVPMQVDEHGDRLAHVQPQQQLLERMDRRVQLGRGTSPSTVQVDGRERAAVVAADDAIWVEHRHELAIRGNQRPSEVIRGHQRSSEVT